VCVQRNKKKTATPYGGQHKATEPPLIRLIDRCVKTEVFAFQSNNTLCSYPLWTKLMPSPTAASPKRTQWHHQAAKPECGQKDASRPGAHFTEVRGKPTSSQVRSTYLSGEHLRMFPDFAEQFRI